MFTKDNAPSGCTIISPETMVGEYSSDFVHFNDGDIIEIEEQALVKEFTPRNSKKTKKVYGVACKINGGDTVFVPIGTFKRRPHVDYFDKLFELSDVFQAVISGDEYSRYKALAGRKIKVDGKLDCKVVDSLKSNWNTNDLVYKDAKLPIFKFC